MSKKQNTEKTTAAKSKAKAKKPEQTKIPGTERRDRIEAIEEAGTAYREARDARMELTEEETERELNLRNVMRAHNVTDYKYEGPDGKMYRVYIGEAKAKVSRVTEPKAPKAAA